MMKIRIHIKKTNGQWYAHMGNQNRATRLAMVPAISFCNRLNRKGEKK